MDNLCSLYATASPGSDVSPFSMLEVPSQHGVTVSCQKSTHLACWNVRAVLDTDIHCIMMRTL